VPALHWLVQFLVSDRGCGPRVDGVLALAWNLVLWQGRFHLCFFLHDFRSIAKASFGRDRVCMGTAAAFLFFCFEVY
jgi:hypothetical protein